MHYCIFKGLPPKKFKIVAKSDCIDSLTMTSFIDAYDFEGSLRFWGFAPTPFIWQKYLKSLSQKARVLNTPTHLEVLRYLTGARLTCSELTTLHFIHCIHYVTHPLPRAWYSRCIDFSCVGGRIVIFLYYWLICSCSQALPGTTAIPLDMRTD